MFHSFSALEEFEKSSLHVLSWYANFFLTFFYIKSANSQCFPSLSQVEWKGLQNHTKVLFLLGIEKTKILKVFIFLVWNEPLVNNSGGVLNQTKLPGRPSYASHLLLFILHPVLSVRAVLRHYLRISACSHSGQAGLHIGQSRAHPT
jgi:hypothetical protein